MSVYFDELFFNDFKFVGRNRLAVKHREIIIEDIFLGEISKVGMSSTGNGPRTLWQDSQVGLIIVVKVPQVESHISVANFSCLFIMELHQVLVKVLFLLLHSSGGMETTIKNSH